MKNFCDLSREEQLELINHVLDGKALEVCSISNSGVLDEDWYSVDYLPEYEDGVYRKAKQGKRS